MSQTPVVITPGTGGASIAAELISGNSFQQIEVYGGGGASVLSINPDGSIKASIIGTATVTFSGAPSISGQVGASIIGTVPVTGSLSITQGSSVTGQVQGFNAPTASITGNPVYIAGKDANGSVAGVQIIAGALLNVGSVSGTVGASIVGQLPAGTAPLGSVATLQGTVPWIISSVYGNISGSVAAFEAGTWNVSIVSTVPSSVIVGASIYGQLPAGTAPIGSVAALQGTTPWLISSVYGNISGSVAAFLQGTVITSLVSTVPSSVQVGASIIGLTPVAVTNTPSISGRIDVGSVFGAVTPYALPANYVSGVTSIVTGTAVTSLIAAPGAGLRNYITHIVITNQQTSVTGAGTTVNIQDDGSGTVLYAGYAAAGGGGYSLTMPTPLRQPTSTFSLSIKAVAQASIIAAATGFTAA